MVNLDQSKELSQKLSVCFYMILTITFILERARMCLNQKILCYLLV